MMIKLVEVIIGFASGLMVGSGFVAFLTVLGILPRLVQLSKSLFFIRSYEGSVVVGGLFGTFLSFSAVIFHIPLWLESLWGIFHGLFLGMLAAALTEVLNVFPILAKRIGMDSQLLWLVMAIVFGKIFGSLFQWLIFVK